MHEGAITRGIVQTVLETIAEQNITTTVRKVHLTVGVCQGFVPESMQFFFEMEKEGTALKNADLEITLQPMVAFCPKCKKETELEMPILLCSQCGKEMEMVRGKELLVTAIEVDQ